MSFSANKLLNESTWLIFTFIFLIVLYITFTFTCSNVKIPMKEERGEAGLGWRLVLLPAPGRPLGRLPRCDGEGELVSAGAYQHNHHNQHN